MVQNNWPQKLFGGIIFSPSSRRVNVSGQDGLLQKTKGHKGSEREREREREKRKFKKTKDVPITTSRGQDRGRNVTLDLRDRVEKMFFSVAVERIRIEGPHPFGLGEGP